MVLNTKYFSLDAPDADRWLMASTNTDDIMPITAGSSELPADVQVPDTVKLLDRRSYGLEGRSQATDNIAYVMASYPRHGCDGWWGA